MPERPEFDTITAPLAHWANRRGGAVAVADGERALSFAALRDAVRCRAHEIAGEGGPAIAWVRDTGGELDRLVDFCAIVETGRAAAIADPEWPAHLRATIDAALPRRPADSAPPRPTGLFYIGFTSGSTGLPKGFARDHRSWTESLRVSLDTFGPGGEETVLAPGRLSHSLFLFAALQGLWTGAGVHLQDRFSAARCLDLLAREEARCLVAVPSQILLMLDAAARRGQPPIPGTLLVQISGARWMRHETPRLRALFPNARIVEFYGASETSFIAWTDSDRDLPEAMVGQPFAGVEVMIRQAAEPDGPGLIFVRGPMTFAGYVLGDDGSLLREGDWLSVRDMGFQDAEGRLYLVGREKRMIVTQGKNLYPEEVEALLERHPDVAAASVLGLPDALRGTRVVALAHPRPGAAPTPEMLAAYCREHLPPFKVPRRFRLCEAWPRTASGKTDHAALAAGHAAWLSTT